MGLLFHRVNEKWIVPRTTKRWIDSTLCKELPSKTRYGRRDIGTGFSGMQIIGYNYRTVELTLWT
jgi:hypothetical protein